MNLKKAVAAAFGAALLSASTGAAGHALLDKNKAGSATQNPKAKGGTAKATANPTAKVTTKSTAKTAIVSGGGNKGVSQSVSTKNKGGKAQAHNKGGAKGGGVNFKIK